MGIYGYKRDTTPKLANIRKEYPDNFFLFDDVTAPSSLTTISLNIALTDMTVEDHIAGRDKITEYNIISQRWEYSWEY